MAVDVKGIGEIKIFVDHFYLKIRQDELLAPVFEEKIGGNWNPHLQKMYKFWDTVLFGQQSYKGSPFLKHFDLPVEGRHFERWTNLFNHTIDKFFSGPKAEEAKIRAGMMAQMFQKKMNLYKDSDSKPLL